MDGRHVRKRIKAARRAEKGKISTAKTLAEARRLLNHPLPIGSQRPKGENGKHGYQVPNDLIIAALRRANGITFRALEYIRANGFPCYAHNDLRSRIAHNAELQAVIDESRMDICCDAVDALREAVRRGEDWAVRQVLNSPLASDLQLGQPAPKIAVDARSVSIGNGSGVLDSIDLQQRLARLGTALQGLAGIGGNGGASALPAPAPAVALPSPAMDAAPQSAHDPAPLVVDAEPCAPQADPCALVPSPPCSYPVDNPVDNPDLPTSHNYSYVSEPPITEPKSTPQKRGKRNAKAARKQSRKERRERGKRGADALPEAAQGVATAEAHETPATPRKRGRPRGSLDSRPRRRRDPGRGKKRATGGGL